MNSDATVKITRLLCASSCNVSVPFLRLRFISPFSDPSRNHDFSPRCSRTHPIRNFSCGSPPHFKTYRSSFFRLPFSSPSICRVHLHPLSPLQFGLPFQNLAPRWKRCIHTLFGYPLVAFSPRCPDLAVVSLAFCCFSPLSRPLSLSFPVRPVWFIIPYAPRLSPPHQSYDSIALFVCAV